MKQVFKLYYDFNKTQLRIIEELSYHTTKLYNIVNYDTKPFNYKSYTLYRKMELIHSKKYIFHKIF